MNPEPEERYGRELCPVCKKYIYPALRDAQGALNSMRKRLPRGRRQTGRAQSVRIPKNTDHKKRHPAQQRCHARITRKDRNQKILEKQHKRRRSRRRVPDTKRECGAKSPISKTPR